MSLQQLREKRARLVADMEAVLQAAEAEGRTELDADETELYAEAEAELGQVKAAIERRESLDRERAELQAVGNPASTRAHGANEPARPMGPEASIEFESLGEFMHSVRFNPSDQRLDWVDAEPQANDGQRMDTGSTGGYKIPQKFRDELLVVSPQEAIFRPRARVIEPGTPPDAAITMPALDQTGDAPGNRYGGVEVAWIGEGETKPATEANFREITLQPQELAGHIPVTDKFLRNWAAASQFLEQQLRGALVAAEDMAFLRGNGIAKPHGAVDAGATYAVNRSDANEINYGDLVKMWSRLHGNGVWVANRECLQQLAQIEDSQGNLVWQPNAREGMPGSIFGMPLVLNERSPRLGSRGDLMLMDASYYLVKDGSGPAVAMGYANDDFTRNRSRIKIFHNVDGKPWLTEPFKTESGFEVSPFVALDVPNG